MNNSTNSPNDKQPEADTSLVNFLEYQIDYLRSFPSSMNQQAVDVVVDILNANLAKAKQMQAKIDALEAENLVLKREALEAEPTFLLRLERQIGNFSELVELGYLERVDADYQLTDLGKRVLARMGGEA
jgi:hypothetical protein